MDHLVVIYFLFLVVFDWFCWIPGPLLGWSGGVSSLELIQVVVLLGEGASLVTSHSLVRSCAKGTFLFWVTSCQYATCEFVLFIVSVIGIFGQGLLPGGSILMSDVDKPLYRETEDTRGVCLVGIPTLSSVSSHM